jgi:hypothetical protein
MPPLPLLRCKRVVTFASFASLALAAAVACAHAQDAPAPEKSPPSGPHVKASAEKFDFGKVVAGTAVSAQLLIDSVGDAPLAVTRVGVTCECAKLRLSTARRLNVPIDREDQGKTDLVLQPGERATLAITIDTTKLAAGEFQKGCKVFCSDAARSPLSIDLVVNVERLPPPQPVAAPAPVAKGPAAKEGDAKTPDVDPSQPAPAPILDTPGLVPLPTALQGGPPPKIECDQPTHDFGEVYRGETVHHTFKVRNGGEGELLIDKVRSSCACTAAKLTIGGKSFGPDEIRDSKRFGTLKKGEEATIDVEFKTAKASVPGKDVQLDKRILVYSNDLTRNPLSLSLDATMTSPFTVEPPNLDFGRVKHGQTKTVAVTVYSDKLGHFDVTDARSPNEELVKVKLTREPDDGSHPPAYRVEATLLPSAPLGTFSNRVDLVVDHERVKEISLPVSLLVEPNVSFTTNADREGVPFLDFDRIKAGETKTLEITIVNGDPTVPYVPKDVKLQVKPNADGFKTEIVEVEKGVKYTVKVTAPATQAKRFFFGDVVITADHPDVPVQKLQLRGWCLGADPK